ncbi:MAG: ABC transporter permease [Acidimicrobiia bacterium]|jgi:putative ABC transport system permease protein
MHRRVPVARRNLLADGRSLVAGVLGVGLALMLVLLLDGLWQGVQRQATAYPDRVGADLFVTQPGIRDFLGETSSIPRSTVQTVRDTRGVDWADPVRGQFVVFDLHTKKVAAYVIGSEPGGRGGPWAMADGRRPRRDDEIVVDRALAQRHGLGIGDRLGIGGSTLRIVGLADASAPMTGFVFMAHATADELFRTPDTTSFVLVGTDRPLVVRGRLERQGLSVLSADEVAANDRRLYTDIFGSPLKVMVTVAFVTGALVVALSVYASVIARRREYGIIKAIGASGWTIAGMVVRQTLALSVIGLGVGAVLFLGARALLASLRPQFSVVLTTSGLVRALAAAILMGLIASVVPVRRVAAADPATVYRGT